MIQHPSLPFSCQGVALLAVFAMKDEGAAPKTPMLRSIKAFVEF